jgi:hypothetical protein
VLPYVAATHAVKEDVALLGGEALKGVPRINPNNGFKVYRGGFDLDNDDYMAVRASNPLGWSLPPLLSWLTVIPRPLCSRWRSLVWWATR